MAAWVWKKLGMGFVSTLVFFFVFLRVLLGWLVLMEMLVASSDRVYESGAG